MAKNPLIFFWVSLVAVVLLVYLVWKIVYKIRTSLIRKEYPDLEDVEVFFPKKPVIIPTDREQESTIPFGFALWALFLVLSIVAMPQKYQDYLTRINYTVELKDELSYNAVSYYYEISSHDKERGTYVIYPKDNELDPIGDFYNINPYYNEKESEAEYETDSVS
jgi:hypothetical protein